MLISTPRLTVTYSAVLAPCTQYDPVGHYYVSGYLSDSEEAIQTFLDIVQKSEADYHTKEGYATKGDYILKKPYTEDGGVVSLTAKWRAHKGVTMPPNGIPVPFFADETKQRITRTDLPRDSIVKLLLNQYFTHVADIHYMCWQIQAIDIFKLGVSINLADPPTTYDACFGSGSNQSQSPKHDSFDSDVPF